MVCGRGQILIRYNHLALSVQKITSKLKDLDPRDAFRIKCTTDLLEKLLVSQATQYN